MKRGNRGFTIVEVVMAILIAVVVSVAAASVIIATRSSSARAETKHIAVGQVNTLLECFKSSDDYREFADAACFAFGQPYATGGDLGNKQKSYKLYFYFNADNGNLPVTYKTDANAVTTVTPYTYFVYVDIECEKDGDFTTATFNASAYEYMSDNSNLSNADASLIYNFSDEVAGGYKKGAA